MGHSDNGRDRKSSNNSHLVYIDHDLAEQVADDAQFQKDFAKCLACLEDTFQKFLDEDEEGIMISIRVTRA